jgi:hypothetical protein
VPERAIQIKKIKLISRLIFNKCWKKIEYQDVENFATLNKSFLFEFPAAAHLSPYIGPVAAFGLAG